MHVSLSSYTSILVKRLQKSLSSFSRVFYTHCSPIEKYQHPFSIATNMFEIETHFYVDGVNQRITTTKTEWEQWEIEMHRTTSSSSNTLWQTTNQFDHFHHICEKNKWHSIYWLPAVDAKRVQNGVHIVTVLGLGQFLHIQFVERVRWIWIGN